MTTEERLQMEVRVVLGLCLAIPTLNCKTAQSVVKVMTCKELVEFTRALEESEAEE